MIKTQKLASIATIGRNAWSLVVLSIALSGGGCSSDSPTCNLPGPVIVDVDASTDGLPADGNYGSVDECAHFCDPSRSSCQRLSDSQVRCSNDRVGCQ
jgi:hypothetical protein